eukprot:352088-Chlamydomonas_euryale.AAC.11
MRPPRSDCTRFRVSTIAVDATSHVRSSTTLLPPPMQSPPASPPEPERALSAASFVARRVPGAPPISTLPICRMTAWLSVSIACTTMPARSRCRSFSAATSSGTSSAPSGDSSARSPARRDTSQATPRAPRASSSVVRSGKRPPSSPSVNASPTHAICIAA